MRPKHDIISRFKPLKNLRRQMGVGVGDVVEIVYLVGCISTLTAAFCPVPSIEQPTLTRQVRNDARFYQAIERHVSSIPIPVRIIFGLVGLVVRHLQTVNGLPSLTARCK